MRANTYTVSASAGGNSHSSVFLPDLHISPFNIGFGAIIATTCKFTIQHTFKNPDDGLAASDWFSHEYVVAASANIDGNYAFPVRAIRVQASAASEGGVSVTFIQAGIL